MLKVLVLLFICLLAVQGFKIHTQAKLKKAYNAFHDSTHDCSIKKCPNEWKKCSDDPKCAKIIHGCAAECSDDSSCWRKCLTKGGDSNAVNLMRCGEANGCYKSMLYLKETEAECMQKHCQIASQTCRGSRACSYTINYCTKQCNRDENCWKKCLDVEGNEEAKRYIQCGVDNNCWKKSLGDSTHDCSIKKCPNEWKKCSDDPKCPPVIHGCAQKCDDDS